MSIKSHLQSFSPKPQVREVDMSEHWGCSVYVRKLSLKEALGLESLVGNEVPITKVCAAFMCEADGTPVFSEDDHSILEKYYIDELKMVIDAAQKFNGMDVEAAKKN